MQGEAATPWAAQPMAAIIRRAQSGRASKGPRRLSPSSAYSPSHLAACAHHKQRRRLSATRPGSNLRLGGQGQFLRLSFEKTPQNAACAAERHSGSDAGRLRHDERALHPPWSIPMCGSAGQMAAVSHTGCLGETLCELNPKAPPPFLRPPFHLETLADW